MAKKSEEAGVRKRKAAAPEAEPAPKLKRTRAASEQPESPTETPKAGAKTRSSAAKSAAKAKSSASKPRRTSSKKTPRTEEPAETVTAVHEPVVEKPVLDPVGDTNDGEARFYMGDLPDDELHPEMAAYRADTADDAIEGTLESGPALRLPSTVGEDLLSAEADDSRQSTGQAAGIRTTDEVEAIAPEKSLPAAQKSEDAEPEAESRQLTRLERLQKILSQAGIASRRHAEELITAGRVMVNGQVVAQLGAKADPTRDHIRVDGKLISGAERHRYFMLNKPRGFVTTVSDPEGRPTVMQFFAKMSERLYPVGRLDYESEGLLLVTNDGELANQLTRAASNVEKTYLVKVAGRLTEDDLDQLRSGVRIERGAPGSDKVHTAPAEIRQVRQGDNPWYEVVLIEGRNRELRKMFQTVGHFVEKIRRVGYGPLVLDVEPGKLRELSAEELSALRLAAEGKWKKKRPAQMGLRSRSGKPDRPQTGRTQARESGRPFPPREAGNRTREGGERRAGGFGQRKPEHGAGQRPGQQAGPGTGRRPERPFQRQQGGKPFRESSGWKPREDRSGAGPRFQERGFGDRSQQRPRGPNFGDARRGGDKFAGKTFGEGRPQRFGGDRAQRFGEGSREQTGERRNPRFGESRGERSREGQSARFSERGGKNPSNRPPGRTWNRGEDRRPTGQGSEPKFRRPFDRERDRRPAPEGRQRPSFDRGERTRESGGERSTERGPRGFTPGRSSKPGGQRSGFRGGPGGPRRGGPPRPGGPGRGGKRG